MGSAQHEGNALKGEGHCLHHRGGGPCLGMVTAAGHVRVSEGAAMLWTHVLAAPPRVNSAAVVLGSRDKQVAAAHAHFGGSLSPGWEKGQTQESWWAFRRPVPAGRGQGAVGLPALDKLGAALLRLM